MTTEQFRIFFATVSSLVPSYSYFRMDYTKRLFILFQQRTKRFSRHPAVQRPNALENSLLAKLPTELLQQIANDLPVASAASFSLSCRHIHLLIGTQYLENLVTSSHETLVFLKLVEHDLQNHIVCNSCRKLHRIQDARKYTENGQRVWPVVVPDCLSDDRDAMVTLFIHENFSTTVFKMAMKHYHYDPRSRQLLNLLSGKFCTHAWGHTLVKKTKSRMSNKKWFPIHLQKHSFPWHVYRCRARLNIHLDMPASWTRINRAACQSPHHNIASSPTWEEVVNVTTLREQY